VRHNYDSVGNRAKHNSKKAQRSVKTE